MWQSWKVRAIPFCATRCKGRPVISSPAKMIRPEVGFSTLVMRLKSVDLPAPFGPMTARISPGSTERSTSSRARSAPKYRERPAHSRSGTWCLLRGLKRDGGRAVEATHDDAPDALRRQHDEADEDGSEDQGPEIGEARQLVLEEEE